MDIDPADATAVQVPIAHKGHDLTVRHHARLAHLLVEREPRCAVAAVADQQFSKDQDVAFDLVTTEQPVHLGRIRRAIGEKTNPDGRIDENQLRGPMLRSARHPLPSPRRLLRVRVRSAQRAQTLIRRMADEGFEA
jgi:hypothetical protein